MMTGNPEVTVVMIFLNAEEFMREAIQSVFEQSYKDWELVFVDDGSTDGSTAIALEYAEKYPQKVRYVQHPNHENRGASAARNAGIRNARGEFIALIDADDVWLPEKLSEQVRILKAHPEAAMLYGYTYYWYSWADNGENANADRLIEPGVELDRVNDSRKLLAKFLRGEVAIPCPTDLLIRREAIDAVGGFEEQFRRIFTDQVFYAKLCLKFPIYVSSRCWFKYRKHPNSSVSIVKRSGEWRSARLNYLRWVERYFLKQGVADKDIWKALKAAKLKCRYPALARIGEHARRRAITLREPLRSLARFVLPAKLHQWLRAQWHSIIDPQPRAERGRR